MEKEAHFQQRLLLVHTLFCLEPRCIYSIYKSNFTIFYWKNIFPVIYNTLLFSYLFLLFFYYTIEKNSSKIVDTLTLSYFKFYIPRFTSIAY